MSWLGIAENLISEILSLVFIAAIAWLILISLRRPKLLRFFGVSNSKRIVIYLSNIRVLKFGAKGIDGKSRSYEGSAAAFQEIVSAMRFRDLFNYLVPKLSDQPGILSKLLVSDITVQVEHSPLDTSRLENSSPFICIGSSAYNVSARFIENDLNSKASIELGTLSVPISGPSTTKLESLSSASESTIHQGMEPPPSGSSMRFDDKSEIREQSDYPATDLSSASGPELSPIEEVKPYWGGTAEAKPVPRFHVMEHTSKAGIPPSINVNDLDPILDTTYGFVERVTDARRSRHVFYVAGLSELSTAGAATFLASQWRMLEKKFGVKDPFLIMLRFQKDDYRKWSIVFERSYRTN